MRLRLTNSPMLGEKQLGLDSAYTHRDLIELEREQKLFEHQIMGQNRIAHKIECHQHSKPGSP